MPEPYRNFRFAVAGALLSVAVYWTMHRVQVQRFYVMVAGALVVGALAVWSAMQGQPWVAAGEGFGAGWCAALVFSTWQILWGSD